MKKTIKEKFVTYEKLRMSFTRNGVVNPGRVARLMFEVFVTGEAKISADFVEKRKICGGLRGNFAVWREDLISKGWLRWDKNFGYQPGVQLVPFVNEEKLSKYAVATTDELDKVKARVSQLESALKLFIEDYDPPFTEEKIKNRLKLV